ncbi:hypothetical protein WA026_017902 [Henosepilachna vigintioctopunctata]|uniref:Uncharacterized protein n=1 Tax=Henosepilachna vigintioctopunctata TaxID=420089 RepID=A0AAW1TV22_9CUCU
MNILVIIAAIFGLTNSSTSDLLHGFTRTTIKGPSGIIIQETPGAHILKSFLSSKVYAPTFPGAVAVPEPVIADTAPIVPVPLVETPLVHSVVPKPVVPAPVLHDAFLPHPPAVPFISHGPAALLPAPVPFLSSVDSRVGLLPPFLEPSVPFSAPVPVVDTRFFPHNPLFFERVVHPAPFVPAPVPVPVPAIDVHPVKTFPEIVFGKYPPAVPPTEYGL